MTAPPSTTPHKENCRCTAVHVWWLDLSVAGALDYWPADGLEQERAGRFSRFDERQRFLAGRLLLRAALGYVHGVEDFETIRLDSTCRCGRSHGKPSAPDLGSQVSVSHSHDLVVVAVCADAPVGVDVELVRSIDDHAGVAERIRHPDEPWPRSSYELFDCWTRKEAVVKASGAGLTQPFDQIDVSRSEIRARAPLGSVHDRCQVFDLPLVSPGNPRDTYAGAVAVLDDHPARPILHAAGIPETSRSKVGGTCRS